MVIGGSPEILHANYLYKQHGMQDVIIASDVITGGTVIHWKDW